MSTAPATTRTTTDGAGGGARRSATGPAALLMALLLAAASAVATAAPASAHARFLGSDPEEGTVVQALPDTVVMSYNEEIAPQFVDTAVVPPGGDPVEAESTAEGTDVIIDLAATTGLAEAATTGGEWQVVARVVSVDGHPVEHTTRFVLEPPAAPETPASAEPSVAPEAATTGPTPEPTVEPPTVAPGAAASTPEESPVPTTIAADPAADTSTGLPGWAVVAGVVVLAVAAVGGVAAYRRSRSAG